MATNKDLKSGTWTSRFYYTDYEGVRKQKYKRGFKTKKEAQEFEREFLAKSEFKVTMTFKDLADIYLEDMKLRLKKTTIEIRKSIIEQRILPFFSKIAICDIDPGMIRRFQNYTITHENGYSHTYLKLINITLSGIFNYAVSFHNLEENPCKKAGSIGKTRAGEMNIWTLEEFEKVIAKVEKIDHYTALNVLFWTGLRIGELLALTLEDIDLEKGIIRVNKTFSRVKGGIVIGEPKTAGSKRSVLISRNLVDVLVKYKSRLYEPSATTRFFRFDSATIRKSLKLYAKIAEVKSIRVHDLRHSHASLLIHLGINPLLISKRLGHEKVDTTLNIYSHLYPASSEKMIELLNEL